MPATAYLSEAGLRALYRNPGAVRKWPEQRMPAFDASVISDADIDAVIVYLRVMAARPNSTAAWACLSSEGS